MAPGLVGGCKSLLCRRAPPKSRRVLAGPVGPFLVALQWAVQIILVTEKGLLFGSVGMAALEAGSSGRADIPKLLCFRQENPEVLLERS